MDPNAKVLLLSEPLLPIDQIVTPAISSFLHEIAISQGRVPEPDLRILVNAVSRCRPSSTLEIGLASGSTAVAIIGSKGDLSGDKHVAVDPYQASLFKNEALARIERLGLSDRFRLVELPSHIALPQLLVQEDPRFDFVYIDGIHKFDYTLLEWFYSDQMLNVGGVIAFDDCQWAMVQSVANFIEANCSYKFVKHNERTWLAVKMGNDSRRWFDFSPFVVSWGTYYSQMIETVRVKVGAKQRG